VEIWPDATQFPEKEYINGIFVAVQSIGLRAAQEEQKIRYKPNDPISLKNRVINISCN
jgi:hypothetical protein